MSARTTTLENGLTIVSHNMEHVETVSLGMWTRAGARDEADDENGLAHLLEHMAFKATKEPLCIRDCRRDRSCRRRHECLHIHGNHCLLCPRLAQ